MMRTMLGVLLGAVVGSLVFFLGGFVANLVDPTPPELMDPATPEAVAQRVASTPTGKWLSTIFGLALGSFLGGFVGARVAKENLGRVTTAIGIALSLWAFLTFYVVYPDVLWVPAIMLISVFLFSYLGQMMFTRSVQKKRAAT